MKEESSRKLEEYNEECIKVIFKSGIINKKQRSTQTTNFRHYLVTRDPKYKNKDTAFLEVIKTCETQSAYIINKYVTISSKLRGIFQNVSF
jgi:hypothetical protein